MTIDASPLRRRMAIPRDLAGTTFRAFGTTVGVWITPARYLAQAEQVLRQWVHVVDGACSRFRSDNDLSRVNAAAGCPVHVSAEFLDALGAAIAMAEMTQGWCDPTIGAAVIAAGYDRPFDQMPLQVAPAPSCAARRVGDARWRQIIVDHRRSAVTIPPEIRLDFGASAKGWAVDVALQRILDAIDDPCAGACVSAGGDLGVAGHGPLDGWPVRLSETLGSTPSDADTWIALGSGGMATSGALHRRWRVDGASMHHLIDPRTGLPARSHWRMVTVAAPTCLAADCLATAAFLMGHTAIDWLEARTLRARLVDEDGGIVSTCGGLDACAPPTSR